MSSEGLLIGLMSFMVFMKLIKPINRPSLLIPYEQLITQQFFHKGSLIPEQNCYDHNSLFKLAKIVDIT